MSDKKKILAEKFKPKNRFSNFGSALASVEISGFRGVTTKINLDYPVTAITGFNGSGKSTVGQLLLCGYRKLTTSLNSKRFYIKDFFPASAVDPNPFIDGASITYHYQTDKPEQYQSLTVSRKQKEWSGYKRQPERNTEYVGFTVYIPKVERRDLSIYSASTLKLTEKTEVEHAKKYASGILGTSYDSVYFQGVSTGKKSAELGVVERFGAKYSENNMGFGEGRVVYIVRLLETCPIQSLIVLEEPETSLHENAQYEFAKYLIDVAIRRQHQIIFSTHSSKMMDALPEEGRKLLVRSANGVQVYDNVSSARIKTALSDGSNGHTIICVEDLFAQSLLREILKRYNLDILKSTSIIPFGDKKAVAEALRVLKSANIKAIAVRDADVGSNEAENLFSLPGSLPPEKEVFCDLSVLHYLMQSYGFDFSAFSSADPDFDHHKYSEHISGKVMCSREVLETDCIRTFLDSVGPSWYETLCLKISKNV